MIFEFNFETKNVNLMHSNIYETIFCWQKDKNYLLLYLLNISVVLSYCYSSQRSIVQTFFSRSSRLSCLFFSAL